MLKDRIQELSKNIHAEIVEIRRHMHQHPELSYEEVETGKYIARQLDKLGVEYQHGIAENGVVALIKGRNPEKKVIALRADFDALPILEKNDVPYKSKNKGVMHACGHDAHTSSLLGTARILKTFANEFEGTVKLIFQPAEEKLPGGASIMIKEGILENPAPVAIFGQHVHPPLEAGKIGIRAGKYMASADEITVKVHGKGGHGALPQDCIDPVVITAHIITALQQVISRRANPSNPSVLTFGKIETLGGAHNIIPNTVKLLGTFRAMNEEWRAEAHRIMKDIAEGMAKAMGGSCEFIINKGYPFLMNNEVLTHKVRARAVEYLGAENVVDLPIWMAAEDFSYYSQEMPGTFYRLGTGNIEKGITSPVHTDTFDIDEDALLVGPGLMAWFAIQELLEE